MSALHVFTVRRQPAERWVDEIGSRKFVHRNPSNRLLVTTCCGKRRPAKNLDVQAYYDGVGVFCRHFMGCKVPRRRQKAARILAREFKDGLSMVGLARKYAMTRRQVENQIRRVAQP